MLPTRLRHVRRNFSLYMVDYLLFGTSMAMIGASTVVPDFVSRLTTDDRVIGLSGAVFMFAWLLPQMFLAQLVNRGTRRKPFIYPAIPFRSTLLVLAFLIATIGNSNPTAVLVIFLLLYALFAAGDGLVSIAWADMLGSTLPHKLRSSLFTFGQLSVAFGALAVSELVRRVLGPTGPAFPNNFALLFGIAGVFVIFGGICLSLTREEQSDQPVEPGPTMSEYLPYVGGVLRTDRQFQRFTAMRLLYDLSTMALPFYIVFGSQSLGLENGSLVADSILMSTLGNALASILFGWISRQSGSRAVLRAGGVCKALQPLLALLSLVVGAPALYAAFFLLGFFSAMGAPGYFDWVITHAPPARRPIYIGLTNTLSAASNLAPVLGGFILSLSGSSYSLLFGLAVTFGIIGFGVSLSLSEPRHNTQEQAETAAAAT